MKLAWFAVLTLLSTTLAMADDTPTPLKAGSGQDVASTACAVCHTTDYIIMNSIFLTADAWKAEVTKMRSVYGAPIDDDTADQITTYLAANYAAAKKP